MSEESGADKTEEPTAQRLKKAREDGQIARSQELAPAAMMVIATLFFTMMGQHIMVKNSNCSLIAASPTRLSCCLQFLAARWSMAF